MPGRIFSTNGPRVRGRRRSSRKPRRTKGGAKREMYRTSLLTWSATRSSSSRATWCQSPAPFAFGLYVGAFGSGLVLRTFVTASSNDRGAGPGLLFVTFPRCGQQRRRNQFFWYGQIVNAGHFNTPPFAERPYVGIVRDDLGALLTMAIATICRSNLTLVHGVSPGAPSLLSPAPIALAVRIPNSTAAAESNDKQLTENWSWYKDAISLFGDALYQRFQSFPAVFDR